MFNDSAAIVGEISMHFDVILELFLGLRVQSFERRHLGRTGQAGLSKPGYFARVSRKTSDEKLKHTCPQNCRNIMATKKRAGASIFRQRRLCNFKSRYAFILSGRRLSGHCGKSWGVFEPICPVRSACIEFCSSLSCL